MGAVGGEELMQETSGCEEKILVSIRLRPLNEKEISRNDVSEWECINDNTIICRNTLSVAERSVYPSAFTFDRVFSGDCSTRRVYEEGAKEVVLSVVSGINSTIFAYGQTSSGKTYTMSGITEYTMADIYDYVQKHTEREFFLKFSAIEIYNESVKDLLSMDSAPLRLLDDPERGTTVEKLTEETLRDWHHFTELLSLCEAQRQIGETSLNEASSRSHQILRLTIESSAREFLGNDKSSSLTATVNFVDLAGSERASQSLSAGARLKEGCHINRSLLTLGTVIRKLSKGRNGHIPFRDSKLTRILQSSLGGNAKTAIICTMSPARSHVEQSRNTLFFASRAKEVVNNAQVNVVVSDKALVKQLQRELARLESELKTNGQTPVTSSSTSLLKEKDIQIEELKRELRELTTERDHAQSQVKDLLKMVEEDKPLISSEKLNEYYPKLRVRSTWEVENQALEASVLTNSRILGARAGSFDASQYSDGHSSSSESSFSQLIELEMESLQGISPPQLPATLPEQHVEEIEELSCHGSEEEDLCKEVRCIEAEESTNRYIVSPVSDSSPERYIDSASSSPIANTGSSVLMTVAENEEVEKKENNKFSNFIPFYAMPSPEKPAPWMMEKDICCSGGVKLTRSRSCNSSLMRSSSIDQEAREIQGTPPIWCEKDCTGRPEVLRKKLAALKYGDETERLSRNSSRNSATSTDKDEVKQENVDELVDAIKEEEKIDAIEEDEKIDAIKEDEKIDAIVGNDVAEPETKQISNLQTENELLVLDATVPEAETKSAAIEEPAKDAEEGDMDPIQNAKDVKAQELGVIPTQNDDTEEDSKWPLEFKRLQNDIVELWHSCNVSLVHRTYFLLLFKGDPADSIYMEVELRRLSFLRDTFFGAKQSSEDGRTSTATLSMKALRRERQMLSRQMQKKLSKKEREDLFVEWGIGLNSNHRRLQLSHLLWNDTKDKDHITRSAAIVAKLVNYVEPDQAFKEMFGLSFTPRATHMESPRWAWR